MNEYLVKRKFKFEGMKNLSNLAEKGTTNSPLILPPGIIMYVELYHRTRTYTRFAWKGNYYFYNCLPFGLAMAPWVFLKIMRELVIY